MCHVHRVYIRILGPGLYLNVCYYLGMTACDQPFSRCSAMPMADSAESDAFFATARLWDDGIIDPRQTRTVLGLCLSAIATDPVEGAHSYGVFRH